MAAESYWWGVDLTRNPASLSGWKFSPGRHESFYRGSADEGESSFAKSLPFKAVDLAKWPQVETFVKRGIKNDAVRDLKTRLGDAESRYRWGLGMAHPLGISRMILSKLCEEFRWNQKFSTQQGVQEKRGLPPLLIAAPLAATIGALLQDPPSSRRFRWLVVTAGLDSSESARQFEWTSLGLDLENSRLQITPEWFCSTSETIADVQQKLSLRAALTPGDSWDAILVATNPMNSLWSGWLQNPEFLTLAPREELNEAAGPSRDWRQFAWRKVCSARTRVDADCVALGAAVFAAWAMGEELPRDFRSLELNGRLKFPFGIIVDADEETNSTTTTSADLEGPFWREIPEVWSELRGLDVPLTTGRENRIIVARPSDSSLERNPRWLSIPPGSNSDLIIDEVFSFDIEEGVSKISRISLPAKGPVSTILDWSLTHLDVKTELVAAPQASPGV